MKIRSMNCHSKSNPDYLLEELALSKIMAFPWKGGLTELCTGGTLGTGRDNTSLLSPPKMEPDCILSPASMKPRSMGQCQMLQPGWEGEHSHLSKADGISTDEDVM